MKSFIKNKLVKSLFVLVFCLICCVFCLSKLIVNASENSGEQIINPDWEYYNSLSEEEKTAYQIVPEKYIITNQNTDLVIDDKLPSSFNLTNDNGVNYVSDYIKDQGIEGLCWLYSSLTSYESYIRKNYNEKLSFSIKQFDYSRSNSILDYQRLKIKSPYYQSAVGTGGSYDEFTTQLLYGIAPIENGTENMISDSNYLQPTISRTFNIDKVKYYATSTIDFGKSYYDLDDEKYINYQKAIKTFLKNNGAMYLATYFNSECMYHDDYTNTDILDTNYCNTINSGHAVTLVGWDDNYEYAFCKTDKGTSSDLNNCDNIVSGKGAWIIQNSWGEDSKPFVYVTYQSDKIDNIAGINELRKKDWDNNYDVNKKIKMSYYNNNDYNNISSINEITYASNINEKIERISVQTPYSNYEYKIYLKNNDGDYHLITSNKSPNRGIYSIDLTDDESDYLYLNGGTFTIKYEHYLLSGMNVTVYSKVIDKKDEITAETYFNNDEIYTYTTSANFYTSTHNIANGETLSYKVKDSNNNDITDNFIFESQYVLNNIEKVNMKLLNVTNGNYTIETYYNNVLYDTTQIEVKSFEQIGSSGNGSESDPFIINSISDLKKINEKGDKYLELSYALGSDINMYEYLLSNDWTPIGTKEKPFKGTFDGKNHSINNLYIENEYSGLFGYIEDAKINNITLWGTNIYGTQAGAIAANSKNSTISNVIVTGSINYLDSRNDCVKALGSLVGYSSNDTIEKISSYANVGSSKYNQIPSYIGGIIGYTNESAFKQIYYKGKLYNGNYIGGIVGDASGITMDSITIIPNISNFKKASGLAGLLRDSYTKSYLSLAFINATYDKTNSVNEIINSETNNINIDQIYYVDNEKDTGITITCGTSYYSDCKNIYKITRDNFYKPGTYNTINFDNTYMPEIYRTLKLGDEGYPVPYNMPTLEINENISSEKYIVDQINGFIYDIKVESNDKPYITYNKLSNNINGSNYRIYKKDLSKEITGNDKISTNDVLLHNKKYYILSVLGDCFGDEVVDIGDAITALRYAVNLPINSRRNTLACDINKNNIIDSNDSYKIQRNLAELDTDIYGG